MHWPDANAWEFDVLTLTKLGAWWREGLTLRHVSAPRVRIHISHAQSASTWSSSAWNGACRAPCLKAARARLTRRSVGVHSELRCPPRALRALLHDVAAAHRDNALHNWWHCASGCHALSLLLPPPGAGGGGGAALIHPDDVLPLMLAGARSAPLSARLCCSRLFAPRSSLLKTQCCSAPSTTRA